MRAFNISSRARCLCGVFPLPLVLSLIVVPLCAGPSPITLVNTLGIATPATQFDVNGTSGPAMGFVNPSLDLLFEPLFTLPTATVISEIGGFVETCIEPCSTPRPGRVETHPAVNGAPICKT
jgi:hypothetical protein